MESLTTQLAGKLSSKWIDLISNDSTILMTLAKSGKRGGSNAKFREGWTRSPSRAITAACREAGIPTAQWWEYTGVTPFTAIPEVIVSYSIRQHKLLAGTVRAGQIKRKT